MQNDISLERYQALKQKLAQAQLHVTTLQPVVFPSLQISSSGSTTHPVTPKTVRVSPSRSEAVRTPYDRPAPQKSSQYKPSPLKSQAKGATEDAWIKPVASVLERLERVDSYLSPVASVRHTRDYQEAYYRLRALEAARKDQPANVTSTLEQNHREQSQSTVESSQGGTTQAASDALVEDVLAVSLDVHSLEKDKRVVQRWLEEDVKLIESKMPKKLDVSILGHHTVDHETAGYDVTHEEMRRLMTLVEERLNCVETGEQRKVEAETDGIDAVGTIAVTEQTSTGLDQTATASTLSSDKVTSPEESQSRRIRYFEDRGPAMMPAPLCSLPQIPPMTPLASLNSTRRRPATARLVTTCSSSGNTCATGLQSTRPLSPVRPQTARTTANSLSKSAAPQLCVTFREPLSHQAARMRAARWRTFVKPPTHPMESGDILNSPSAPATMSNTCTPHHVSTPRTLVEPSAPSSSLALQSTASLEEAYSKFAPTAQHCWPARTTTVKKAHPRQPSKTSWR